MENCTLRELLATAYHFNLRVDVRGIYPVLIDGARAATIRRRRDILNFLCESTRPGPADNIIRNR